MALYDSTIAREFINSHKKNNEYSFDISTGIICTSSSNNTQMILHKISNNISKTFDKAKEANHRLSTNIHLIRSEIASEMEASNNSNAFFILPSQLNGAEYPDDQTIVKKIEEYYSDNTAGPAGQLALDNVVGQFILDNAKHTNQKGIDCFKYANRAVPLCESINGYLRVDPRFNSTKDFATNLSQIVIFGFENVRVNGFNRHKNRLTKSNNTINVIYGSALPINTYVNPYDSKTLQCASRLLLFAEYYGCLRAALMKSVQTKTVTKVYLLLLGGGVFNNDYVSIIYSIYQAMYVLEYEYGSQCQYIRPIILVYERDPMITDYSYACSIVEKHFKKIEK